MSSKELIDTIFNLGGVAGIAVFAIYILNKVWELRLEDAQRYSQNIEEMRAMTFTVLQENVSVMQKLSEQLDSLLKRGKG